MTDAVGFIRDDIKSMSAYKIADLPEGFVKLDAMESPYHPFSFSETLLQEWKNLIADAAVHLYPNPAGSGLQEVLREVFGIADEAALALGNGSDELIQFLTALVAKPGAVMLALEPGFVMYRHNAALYGMEYVGVPLNSDFTMNLPAVLEAVRRHRPALVFLAYPNNPTGVRFSREEVAAVVEASEGIVVVDEAYSAFSDDSFLSLAGKIANLVVMRTISKIGFAGLRIGYAAGCPQVMDELAKILPPYNMNQLSLATAKFALRHYGQTVQTAIDVLKAERARVYAALSETGSLQVFPSEANFITVRVPDACALFEALKAERILIKNLHGVHPLLEQCVRITIGSPQQNDALLGVVRKFYSHS